MKQLAAASLALLSALAGAALHAARAEDAAAPRWVLGVGGMH